MDRAENKESFEVWQKLYTSLKGITFALKRPPNSSTIITLIGIIGIIAYFLAPFTGFYTFTWFDRAVNAMSASRRRSYAPKTTTYEYQRLHFDYLCTLLSTANASFTTRCTTTTKGGSSQLTTLSCDLSTVLLEQFLRLQNDGKCVVTNAEVANDTGVIRDWEEVHSEEGMLAKIAAAVLWCIAGGFYFFRCFKTVEYFALYRRMFTSSPALSAQTLRGRFLTPDWQKFFRSALAVSCLILLYHGLFALLAPYTPEVLAQALSFGTVVAPVFPLNSFSAISERTRFVLSLPDNMLWLTTRR